MLWRCLWVEKGGSDLIKFSQLFIGLGIAAAALYYTLHNVSIDNLWKTFEVVDPAYLLPTITLIGLSYLVRAFRWKILLTPIIKVRVPGLFSPLMVGYMGNILPGRTGEFFRAYLLSKKYDISFSRVFATIVVERIFDLAMVLLLFIWFCLFRAKFLNLEAVFSGISIRTLFVMFGQISALLVTALILFIYLLVWRQKFLMAKVNWATQRLPDNWKKNIQGVIKEFEKGLLIVKDSRALIKITVYTVLLWTIIIYYIYPLYWMYDLQNKSLESLIIVCIMVAIIILILPSPAMLGSYNIAILIALHEIMGEAEVTVVSLGLLGWSLHFFVLTSLSIYFILHDHVSLSKLVQVKKEREI